MKNKTIFTMIFFFSLLYVYSCIEKNNNYDSNGLKNDYWIEKDSFLDTFSEGFYNKGNKTGIWIEYSDSLVEKGIYKEGKRFGVWKKYLGNTLNEEIEYVQDKDIDIKTTKYFCNNKLYLTEKSLNDQIINVTVSEKLCYSEYFEKFKIRISSDLFLYHCINCHNPLANEDETKFIKETDSMIEFLKSPRHIKVDTASSSLNTFEVEAISNYISNRF